MKILRAIQRQEIGDAVRAKFSMAVPVLTGTLHSLAQERIHRLGGIERVTLWDLAREFKAGSGDTGICFEYAVHEAIAAKDPLIYPLASEVLERFCKIKDGADSILFGPEKNRVIPILESVQNALTDESRVYVGNKGQPPKLKRYIPTIFNAFHRQELRNRLPRSISGLWKADLFVGSKDSDQWFGTSVKINPSNLQKTQGLRLGVYPRVNQKDVPRIDEDLNLIRLPLPYDNAFMESFYKAFYLVRAFLNADAHVPKPVELPDAADRFVTSELEARREFPLLDVLSVIGRMGQPELISDGTIEEIAPGASLTDEGLKEPPSDENKSELVSIAPSSSTE